MEVTAEHMSMLRRSLRSIYDVCEQCDAQGMEVEFCGARLTVRRLFEIEVTAYLLYLAAADKIVSQEEVDFINDLMGREYSLEKCTEFVSGHRMLVEGFSKTTPLSFKLLSDFSEQAGKDISDVLISFYDVLGLVLATSDEVLAVQEAEARTGYIYLLRGYKALRGAEEEPAVE